MTWSSQSRVTRTVESLRVIGLQARVNVESNEISHFFYDFLYAVKWRPISYKMVANVVLASLTAGYLYLSFSVAFYLSLHLQSFQQV